MILGAWGESPLSMSGESREVYDGSPRATKIDSSLVQSKKSSLVDQKSTKVVPSRPKVDKRCKLLKICFFLMFFLSCLSCRLFVDSKSTFIVFGRSWCDFGDFVSQKGLAWFSSFWCFLLLRSPWVAQVDKDNHFSWFGKDFWWRFDNFSIF